MKFLFTQVLLFCVIAVFAQATFESGTYTLSIKSKDGSNVTIKKSITEFDSYADVEKVLKKANLDESFATEVMNGLKSSEGEKFTHSGKSGKKDVEVTFEKGAVSASNTYAGDNMAYKKRQGHYEVIIEDDGDSQKKKIIRMKKNGELHDEEEEVIVFGEEDETMTWHHDDDYAITLNRNRGADDHYGRALMLNQVVGEKEDRKSVV